MLLLSVSPMIMLASLRIDTGADYEQYTWNFMRLVSAFDKWSYIITSREPLCSFLQYLSYSIFGNNYFWWFAIMACATLTIIVISLAKIDRFMDMSMYVLMFGMYAYLHMFNYVRQMLAAALILLALAYCIDNKIVRFIICIVLATMMHQSSIVFLAIPLLYLKRKVFKGIKYHVLILISPVFLGGVASVLRHIPFFSIYVTRYFGTSLKFGIGWIIDVIPIILMYYITADRNNVITDKNSVNAEFFLELGWLIIPIRLLSYYSYAAGRLFIDFAMIAMVGAAINLSEGRNSTFKRIALILIMMIYFIFYFYISNNSDVFPYRTFLMSCGI
jgi:transmembrane protein EpsG